MKFVAAATILAAAATSAAAFTLHNNNVPTTKLATSYSPFKLFATSVSSSSTKTEESSSVCEVPEDTKPLSDLSKQKGSASLLRSVALTNVEGDFVSLGNMMGNEKSVVVFLRHMG